mgnify:CR=1 FL=1|jgi:glycogen synthase
MSWKQNKDKFNEKKIVLIGAFPPPYGGISIHIQRLHRYLLGKGYKCYVISPFYGHDKRRQVPNLSYLPKKTAWIQFLILFYKLLILRGAIRHYHVSSMGNFAKGGWLTMFIPGKNVVTIHSGSFVGNMQKLPRIKRTILYWALLKANKLIAVNKKIWNYCEDIRIPTNKMLLQPAFLKPFMEDQQELDDKLIQKVERLRKSREKLFILSGLPCPLYGIDKFFKALSTIKEKKFGVVVIFYSPIKQLQNQFYKYKEELDCTINSFGEVVVLANDVNNDTFIKIISICDIYVRPTATDGDSVTVREALALRCQVLASSVSHRPEGCALFDIERIDLFTELLSRSLDDSSIGLAIKGFEEDGFLPLASLFDELM